MLKKKSTLIVLVIAVVILGLALYPNIWKGGSDTENQQTNHSVPCLLPNLSLIQHIHATLIITVDGEPEAVPANIGLSQTCERAVHTHETDGVIHVEAQDNRRYVFADFLDVWGKDSNRPGYELETLVDGKPFAGDLAELELENEQIIELHYAALEE